MSDEKTLAIFEGDDAKPVYMRIAEMLRTRIISGELPCGHKLPSEAELAAQLGVNHQTLRKGMRILSDQKLISQCRGRGTFVTYRREERRQRIGVVCHKQDDDLYLQHMIASLNRALSGRHQGELVFIGAERPRQLLHALNQGECDAVISLSSIKEVAKNLCRSEFDHFPMVFVNSPVDTLEKFGRYEVRAAFGAVTAALTHLWELGHRRIGFISCRSDHNMRLERHNREFHTACRALGLDESWCRIGGLSEDRWFLEARDAARSLCALPDRPTAIFCPGLSFSCGAWQGVMEAGLRIPEDISLIGFDANHFINPLMSSMVQPFEAVCEKTIELLSDLRISGKHLDRKVYEFPMAFCDKGSCR